MGTIIELFDAEPLENIASHLLYPEDKPVYLGYPDTMTEGRKNNLRRFFRARNCPWEPEFIEVDRCSLEDITAKAEAVLLREEGCRFDLTGGSELVLVAMGLLSERHKVPMFQTDLNCGKSVCTCGAAPTCRLVSLPAGQLLMLYGGLLMGGGDRELPDSPELRSTVEGLWSFCRKDPRFLNRISSFFNRLGKYTQGLRVDAPGLRPSPTVQTGLRKLAKAGFLLNLKITEKGLRFSYRDDAIRRMLGTAGLTLELMTRFAARECGMYQDVHQGVVLDWDGVVENRRDTAETRNEVDGLLIRGLTPYFLSCKAGDVKKEALYELDVVAGRFGGGYARRALVCSALSGNRASNESLRRRAKDMGITLIENTHALDIAGLAKQLSQLARR